MRCFAAAERRKRHRRAGSPGEIRIGAAASAPIIENCPAIGQFRAIATS
jgi:hypothetical protein